MTPKVAIRDDGQPAGEVKYCYVVGNVSSDKLTTDYIPVGVECLQRFWFSAVDRERERYAYRAGQDLAWLEGWSENTGVLWVAEPGQDWKRICESPAQEQSWAFSLRSLRFLGYQELYCVNREAALRQHRKPSKAESNTAQIHSISISHRYRKLQVCHGV